MRHLGYLLSANALSIGVFLLGAPANAAITLAQEYAFGTGNGTGTRAQTLATVPANDLIVIATVNLPGTSAPTDSAGLNYAAAPSPVSDEIWEWDGETV